MKILKKIGQWFYHRKYTGNICTTRILFFRSSCDAANPKGKKFPPMKLATPKIKNLGRYTYCSTDLTICSGNTSIGSFCSIGSQVTLGHGDHPLNFLTTSPYLYLAVWGFKTENTPFHNEFWEMPPISIGNDVWIGDGVFVKNGITVGDGAVLGARSVVTKDVPPYAIVAGVPAKIIRYRFDEPTRQELLRLKWWELEDDIIRQIPYDNISAALQFLREVRTK